MTNINSSLLALQRKRLGSEQKQIALLLGHKTTYQISRYETGQRVPSLREAVKLSILYGLPIRSLFDRYFRRYREELDDSINRSRLTDKINLKNIPQAEYCSYLELMNQSRFSRFDSDKIRHHIKVLLEERSKKFLGN